MVPRTAPRAPTVGRLQRLAGRWWRRQSPARQDRFVTVAPLVSVLLFQQAIALDTGFNAAGITFSNAGGMLVGN